MKIRSQSGGATGFQSVDLSQSRQAKTPVAPRRGLGSSSGVTLIEILIAVSLLSLLSVAVLVAMRIGFSTMERTDAYLVRNRRVTNTRKILENVIQGFYRTSAEWHPTPKDAVYVPFLDWRQDGLRFVTAYSLGDAWRGQPQLAEMQVIPGEKGEGFRLILNEVPYAGPLQTGLRVISTDPDVRFAPVVPGPSSFVLADKLSQCRFSYLVPIPEEPYRAWRPEWNDRIHLPFGIRIELGEEEVTVAINANGDQNTYRDVF